MPEIDLKIHKRDFNTLLEAIKENGQQTDLDLIEKAYKIAEKAHEGQFRLSGEPFIVHPLEVGIILANLRMDTASITAALLHDVVEDTDTSIEAIRKDFGDEIAHLVNGVTKISSLKNRTKSHEEAESLRKLLLATIDDARVIIIKLADKTHNMRTLMFQPPHKQKKIAQEVFDIYAPIAGRLGMSRVRSELEDLAFHTLMPDEFKKMKESMASKQELLDVYLEKIRADLAEHLKEANIAATIKGRIKHYYSIYNKMIAHDKTFDNIFDIRAIRIITDEVRNCYAILGIIHSQWPPVPSRFKDYIAVPKSNMYQSLHTTVTGPGDHFLEIQIRTNEMDITAEMGIAAHWAYKERHNAKNAKQLNDLSLLKNLRDWRTELNDTREFMRSLKMDLYLDEVFVFTPKGKILRLGKGSTPIDFAYAIHSEVGNHCSGARINNKMVPLKTILNNGDIVEIITNLNKHPSDSWLKFVRSANARNKIRNWLKRQKSEESRVETLPADKADDNTRTEQFAIQQTDLHKYQRSRDKNEIIVDGNNNVPIRLAQCCQPIPGDPVVGFISKGKKISVHKRGCPALSKLNIEPDRFISVVWSDTQHMYPVKILIQAINRKNLLAEVTNEIANLKISINKFEASENKGGYALIKIVIEVKSLDHLNFVIEKLKKIRDVVEVEKVNEKVIKRS